LEPKQGERSGREGKGQLDELDVRRPLDPSSFHSYLIRIVSVASEVDLDELEV